MTVGSLVFGESQTHYTLKEVKRLEVVHSLPSRRLCLIHELLTIVSLFVFVDSPLDRSTVSRVTVGSTVAPTVIIDFR